jgi:hypothetical protein
MKYTEDTLVQQTTAEYLEQQLGWRSVCANNNEGSRQDSLLAYFTRGRADDFPAGHDTTASTQGRAALWLEYTIKGGGLC